MRFSLTIALILITGLLLGQSNDTDHYRIVAFKKTNTDIVSASNIVQSAKRMRIRVPNAFSPDGDGINDTFAMVADGVQEFSIRIHNRWGELVYTSEDIFEAWDGEFKGRLSMQDAYVYVITARGIGETNYTTLKGTVSLIR